VLFTLAGIYFTRVRDGIAECLPGNGEITFDIKRQLCYTFYSFELFIIFNIRCLGGFVQCVDGDIKLAKPSKIQVLFLEGLCMIGFGKAR